MKKISFSILSLSAILFYCSCAKDQTSAATAIDCTGVTAKFAADVLPILNGSKCSASGCHPANGAISSYSAVKGHFDDGHLKPYVVDRTGKPMPPNGSTPLTSDELKKIACWISAGAPNN